MRQLCIHEQSHFQISREGGITSTREKLRLLFKRAQLSNHNPIWREEVLGLPCWRLGPKPLGWSHHSSRRALRTHARRTKTCTFSQHGAKSVPGHYFMSTIIITLGAPAGGTGTYQTHTITHTSTDAIAHTQSHKHTHTFIHTHTYRHTHTTHTHTHTHTHTRTHSHAQSHRIAHTHTHTNVCAGVAGTTSPAGGSHAHLGSTGPSAWASRSCECGCVDIHVYIHLYSIWAQQGPQPGRREQCRPSSSLSTGTLPTCAQGTRCDMWSRGAFSRGQL